MLAGPGHTSESVARAQRQGEPHQLEPPDHRAACVLEAHVAEQRSSTGLSEACLHHQGAIPVRLAPGDRGLDEPGADALALPLGRDP